MIMKRMMMLTAISGVLALTGCSTLNNVLGNDTTGMHDVKSTASNTAPVTSMNGMLVDSKDNMTLYTFDKDTMSNKSECGAACLVAWPAFMAPSDAKASGEFAAFEREDGSYQWAMNGKPLYFYANDTEVGDVDGDNKGGVWHVIKTN